ncbi:MAG TPA: 16S rRNA (cytidine(1402)-2'-O)-methyltransferase [Solirubrobacteraceae bacterium]|nr:16S rRNA (cytidine(1402)-2'-O)-methyltransferase [Solirubrobacteraceae bacterium]
MTRSQAPLGRLAVCPTPIGNLQDVTLRVLDTLANADVVACEDTRHTGRFLQHHGLSVPLVSLHEHNERQRARELVGRIRAGALVALVSDAGMPLIADPGYALVQACMHAHLPVEVLPGASAVTTALVASGLPGARFCFVGFLPRKRSALLALAREARETLVAFESPRRVAATLALLAELDAARPVAVCRELTKLHEEVRAGSAAELAASYRDSGASVRGEVVLVIGAAEPERALRGEVAHALAELLSAGARPRAAAAALAKLTGVSANELYRIATDARGAPDAAARR